MLYMKWFTLHSITVYLMRTSIYNVCINIIKDTSTLLSQQVGNIFLVRD